MVDERLNTPYYQIKMPNTSVNRTDPDGESEDVLLKDYPKYTQWGVLSIVVGDIPSPHRRDPGDDIHYKPFHHPEDNNFYHTEIRAYLDGQGTSEASPSKFGKKTIKTWFRLRFSKVAKVIKPTGI